MLTGDKGKTAKMIGLQCGMFSAESIQGHLDNEKMRTVDMTDNKHSPEKSHDTSVISDYATVAALKTRQSLQGLQKKDKSANKISLFEVNEKCQDVEGEIKKILAISANS
mmetsp:Transcript_38763/g.50754  ORF Transcript_38763/g.50754 Transcript_38763/m.50754 type:complete len:110 (+) Transcript_38763:356-685(+)